MRIIYAPYHVRHQPPYEIFNGIRYPHADVAGRIEAIRGCVEDIHGVQSMLPRHFPLSWIECVHDPLYISYLAQAGREAGCSYVYPSVFPYTNSFETHNSAAQRGIYSFDTYTPISSVTYESARISAMCALTAASLVRRGEKVTYALCRPPGHHAEKARMGGYCYFNNAAIAAHYLSTRGKVAVLDVDVHHGNGTQNIFYNRSDVLVVSIHAHPDEKFPYFSGREDEKGEGKGVGYTINFPLPLGTGDRVYHQVLCKALSRIRSFRPSYLVVSVGYDTHKDDPIGGLSLSTQYFYRMAQTIGKLDIPTVLVQEGGYNTEKIGQNAVSFVRGFMEKK